MTKIIKAVECKDGFIVKIIDSQIIGCESEVFRLAKENGIDKKYLIIKRLTRGKMKKPLIEHTFRNKSTCECCNKTRNEIFNDWIKYCHSKGCYCDMWGKYPGYIIHSTECKAKI